MTWFDLGRFAAATLAACAGAAAVAQWMRGQTSAGSPSAPTPPESPRFPPRFRAWDWRIHLVTLVGASLLLTWVNREAGWPVWAQSLLLLHLLYPLAILDLATLQVDERLVLAGLLLRLGAAFLWERPHLPGLLLGVLTGAGMLTLTAVGYRAVRGRSGLGEGDAGVLALIGAFVGWEGIFAVLLLAAGAGLLVGLAALLTLRKPLDTAIPFVPFLCLAGLLVHLAQRLGLAPALPLPWPG